MRFQTTDPDHPDAQALVARLTETLARITGDGGQGSFDASDVRVPGAIFVVARNEGGPVGCGAFRPMAKGAELKRMFAEPGFGAPLLRHLEDRAREMGYPWLRLSTRAINFRAVRFYEKHGYVRIANFGKYAGSDKSICMEKTL